MEVGGEKGPEVHSLWGAGRGSVGAWAVACGCLTCGTAVPSHSMPGAPPSWRTTNVLRHCCMCPGAGVGTGEQGPALSLSLFPCLSPQRVEFCNPIQTGGACCHPHKLRKGTSTSLSQGQICTDCAVLHWILNILLSKQLSRRFKKTLAYFARIHILSVLLWSPCVVHYDENHFYTSVWMEISAPTQSKFSGHLTGSKLTGML